MFLRSRVAFFLFVFSVFAHASKLPTSFDGYVTSVSGTDAFDVGTRHVKIDRAKTEVTLPDQGVDAENSVDWVLRVGAIDPESVMTSAIFVHRVVQAKGIRYAG